MKLSKIAINVREKMQNIEVHIWKHANSSQFTIVIGKISRVFDRDLHPFYYGLDRESEQQSVKNRNKGVIEAQQHRKSGNSCTAIMSVMFVAFTRNLIFITS